MGGEIIETPAQQIELMKRIIVAASKMAVHEMACRNNGLAPM